MHNDSLAHVKYDMIMHDLRIKLEIIKTQEKLTLKTDPEKVVNDAISEVLDITKRKLSNKKKKVIEENLGIITATLESLVRRFSKISQLAEDAIDITYNQRNMNTVPYHIIEKIYSDIKETYEEEGIELYLENDRGKPIIIPNSDFESLVINLLSNSRNAVSRATEKKISLVSKYEESRYTCTVSDTGCGIDPKRMKDIFNRYNSEWQTESLNRKSTGIGLWLIDNYKRLYGFGLDITSEVGTGTTFSMVFKTA